MEVLIREQRLYASLMRFENQLFWDEWRWRAFEHYPIDREVIFVRSEEEAATFGFPLDVIIGWPSIFSLGLMEGINNTENEWLAYMEAHDLSFEYFGLSMPLTPEDLIENWNGVYRLLTDRRLGNMDIMLISQAENDYMRQSNADNMIRRWLFPGVLDELNRLLNAQEISEEALAQLHERLHVLNRNITIDDIPTFPITEEDARNNPWIIVDISQHMLTEEEQSRISRDPENLQRLFMEAQEGEQQ